MSEENVIRQPLKMCTTCAEDKPLTEFRKQSKNKDGLKYKCKSCDDKHNKLRYEQKKYWIIEQVKGWQQNNPEKVAEYDKKYKKEKSRRKSERVFPPFNDNTNEQA